MSRGYGESSWLPAHLVKTMSGCQRTGRLLYYHQVYRIIIQQLWRRQMIHTPGCQLLPVLYDTPLNVTVQFLSLLLRMWDGLGQKYRPNDEIS